MSRHRRTSPPRYYDRGWPYVVAIATVVAVMVAFYLAIVL